MPKTMFDKIWDAHEVAEGLIYVDLHLVHEVTSPQAFDGLRLEGRKVRRPDKTVATADHNVPDGRHPGRAPDRRRAVAGPGRDAGAKLRRVRHPDLLAGLGPAGHRARDRAGARAHPAGAGDRLRRQPHVHSRRVRRARHRDRDLGGGARARHPVPGPEAAEDDADQLHGRARPRGHREGPDPGDDRPPRRRRHGRPRRRVRGRDDPRALDGEPDDDLQHDDRGRRPRRHGRARRDDLRVGRGPPGGARGLRRGGRPSGARCPPTTAPGSTPRSRSTRPRSPRWSPGARPPGWSPR